MSKNFASTVFMLLGLAGALPALSLPTKIPKAQKEETSTTPSTSSMAGMSGMAGMNGMKMSGAGMSSSVDLNDPMPQEASGTAWLPSSTPMYGKMRMLHGNMLMLHGAVMPRYTDIGSQRGDRRFDAPNWGMAMFSHSLTVDSQLGLRAMLSLDPITEGGHGYPLLFQTGETWHHEPLHDRQHPHNFQSELAATYSRLIGGGRSAYLYLADPGEPALGPPTYMHRLLAYDLADAPIGHHWQDATHIQFGVATVGLNFGSRVKVEASDFTGREPDENRWSFQKARFDSYSSRVSFNPDADNALQVSYGFIKNAEGDGANQHRITASWLYNKPLGDDANFTTALVWGQNNLNTEGKTNSYLAEADYQRGRDTFFSRWENIQKSGHELVLPEEALQGRKFTLGAYTAGYVRDLTHGTGIDTGLGFAVTADQYPSALSADYGSGTPLSFQIYLRFRPSRIKNMSMTKMAMDPRASADAPTAPNHNTMPGMSMPGMSMPGMSMPGMSMPGMSMPGTTGSCTVPTPAQNQEQVPASDAGTTPAPPAPVNMAPTITAVMSPSSPKSQQKNLLTLTVLGSDGKPLVGAKVKASVAMTAMDMGTTFPVIQEIGGGKYGGSIAFAMAGSWRVSVTVTAPGEKTTTKILEYAVSR